MADLNSMLIPSREMQLEMSLARVLERLEMLVGERCEFASGQDLAAINEAKALLGQT